MKFYSAWYCPFAQRVWFALLLKAIDFEYIEVDPYHKSDWWLKVSRNSAKVPVIVTPNKSKQGELTVIESTRIVEYLDELITEIQPLQPQGPNERAEQRYWLDHIDKAIIPYFYRFLQAKDGEGYRDQSKQQMLAGLESITQAMGQSGPFFYGNQISMIDIQLAPFAYRIDVLLGHYREFILPRHGGNWVRYQRWYQSILEEPAFKQTSTANEDYTRRLIKFYLRYTRSV